jgi:DNA-binding Lrp family transcriptional regulator
MDEKRLLEILEDDAGMSAKDIAAMLGAKIGGVEESMKRLRKDGVICALKAVVDWRAVDEHRVAALLQVKVVPQEKLGFDRICAALARDRRVTDVFVTSGKYDLMVGIQANNVDEISQFVTEKLAPMREVTGTYTHIIMKQFKRDGATLQKSKNRRLPVS